jgi:hypothetical protein
MLQNNTSKKIINPVAYTGLGYFIQLTPGCQPFLIGLKAGKNGVGQRSWPTPVAGHF